MSEALVRDAARWRALMACDAARYFDYGAPYGVPSVTTFSFSFVGPTAYGEATDNRIEAFVDALPASEYAGGLPLSDNVEEARILAAENARAKLLDERRWMLHWLRWMASFNDPVILANEPTAHRDIVNKAAEIVAAFDNSVAKGWTEPDMAHANDTRKGPFAERSLAEAEGGR